MATNTHPNQIIQNGNSVRRGTIGGASSGISSIATLYLISNYEIQPMIAAMSVGAVAAIIHGVAAAFANSAEEEILRNGDSHGFWRRAFYGMMRRMS